MIGEVQKYIRVSKKKLRNKIPLKEVIREVFQGIIWGETRSVSSLIFVWILRRWLGTTGGVLVALICIGGLSKISMLSGMSNLKLVLSYLLAFFWGGVWLFFQIRTMKKKSNLFFGIDREEQVKEMVCSVLFYFFGVIIGGNIVNWQGEGSLFVILGGGAILCIIALPWLRVQMNRERSGLYFFPILSKIGKNPILGVNYPCSNQKQQDLYIERELLMLIRGDKEAKNCIFIFESEKYKSEDFLSGIGRFLIGVDQVVRSVPGRHIESFLEEEENNGNHPQVRLWSIQELDVLCVDCRLKGLVINPETEQLSLYFKELCQNEKFMKCLSEKKVILAFKGIDMERYLTDIRIALNVEEERSLALKVG